MATHKGYFRNVCSYIAMTKMMLCLKTLWYTSIYSMNIPHSYSNCSISGGMDSIKTDVDKMRAS